MTEGLTRRHALGAAMAGVAVPALAACGSDDSPSSRATDTQSPTGGTSSPSGPVVLAKTSDVPVGGATFIESPSVVVTQPTAGDFHAFDRTCTHNGCPVQDIVDGKIHCPCHGSLYDMATGQNVGGPAPAPLTTIEINVDGSDIVEA